MPFHISFSFTLRPSYPIQYLVLPKMSVFSISIVETVRTPFLINAWHCTVSTRPQSEREGQGKGSDTRPFLPDPQDVAAKATDSMEEGEPFVLFYYLFSTTP